jgi:hypothetical protein
VSAKVDEEVRALLEKTVRGQANNILNMIDTRAVHPTYGITKARIREEVARLDGIVGTYMLLTGQALHVMVPRSAEFEDAETGKLVHEALVEAYRELDYKGRDR